MVFGSLAMKTADVAVLWLIAALVYGQPMNIALQKTAILSAVAHGGLAERGNDGNDDTDFYHHSCVYADVTSAIPLPWWQVDLGQQYYIYEAVIVNRGGTYAHQLQFITIELYSEDPTVKANTQHQVCSVYNQTASAGETLVLGCAQGTRGRFLRIQKYMNEDMNFCEAEVYGSLVPKNGRFVLSLLPGHKLTGPYTESTNTTLGCAKMCLQTAPCAGFSMDVALEAGQGTCQLFVVISVPAADPAWDAYVIIDN